MAAISPERSPSRHDLGAPQKALRRMLMRRTTVSAGDDVGDRFRLITLEGGQLR